MFNLVPYRGAICIILYLRTSFRLMIFVRLQQVLSQLFTKGTTEGSSVSIAPSVSLDQEEGGAPS